MLFGGHAACLHPVKHSDLAVRQALEMGIGMLAGVCTLSHYSSSVNSNPPKRKYLGSDQNMTIFPRTTNTHTHTHIEATTGILYMHAHITDIGFFDALPCLLKIKDC